MGSKSKDLETLRQIVLPSNCFTCIDWENKLLEWRNEILEESAKAGHTECVMALLAAGLQSFQKDWALSKAMILASRHGHAGCVDVLVKAGAPLDDTDHEGTTALFNAAHFGHDDCVDLLIRAGSNVLHDSLRAAVEKGHLRCAELLVEAGADLDYEDRFGCTPLIAAADRGHSDCVSLLIKAGADVNKKAKNAGDVRALEANKGYCVQLHFLGSLRRGSSDPPLMFAARRGSATCIDMLLQAGADVNGPGVGEESLYLNRALLLTALMGSKDCLSTLLRAGADVNHQNQYGSTALMAAAQEGHDECMNLLIKSGADVNKIMLDLNKYHNYCALTFAVVNCKQESTNMLIKAGADVNRINGNGMTILNVAAIAKQNKFHRII